MRKLSGFAAAIVVLLVIGGFISRAAFDQRATRSADTPVFTSTYTLQTTQSDDLFVIADTAHLLDDSHVQADAALVGRTRVVIDGAVDGDLTALGGDISLGPAVRVGGDAALIGNHVTLGGRIEGDLSVVADTLTVLPGTQLSSQFEVCVSAFDNQSSLDISTRTCSADELAGWQALRDGSLIRTTLTQSRFTISGFAVSALFALAMAALAGLVVTIFPRPFAAMTEAIRSLPVRAARVGCFTQLLIVALSAGLVVVIAVVPPFGLLLLPVLALLSIPLFILFVVGWMTMALLAGSWLLHQFSRSSPSILTVIIGTLGLFVIWTMLTILPYGPILGMVMALMIGTVGMGATILTRAGTRSAGRTYFVQG